MKICKDGRIWGQNNSYNKLSYKKTLSEILKEKRTGNKNPNWKGGITKSPMCKGYNPNSGKHWPKMGRRFGDKNPMWKGGVTSENDLLRRSTQYKIWRKSVFERDNYTCLICGEVGGRLNAHHIKSFADFPELRFDVSNGTTLCFSCHQLETNKKER